MKSKENFLNLQGKVAIITGAATGLGATTAQILAAAGAKVLINHMPGQESQAQAVANDCATESICLAGDITRDEDCKKTIQTTAFAIHRSHSIAHQRVLATHSVDAFPVSPVSPVSSTFPFLASGSLLS